MRKGGGKSKGSGFERKVAKLIVKAFKEFGIEQRECWRSVLSGGHMISCGDLAMSDRLLKLFPYSVECKFRRKVKWQNFFLRPVPEKSQEIQWWKQAEDGATKRAGLDPILVVKENHTPIYVVRCVGSPVLVDRYVAETLKHFLNRAVKRVRKQA